MPQKSIPAPSALGLEVVGLLGEKMGRGHDGKRVTTVALSKATGIARTTLGSIINGQKRADLEQLDLICYALGLELHAVIAAAEKVTGSRAAEEDWSARRLLP